MNEEDLEDITYDIGELQHHMVASSRFADWIYHDERLDCDQESGIRTAQRFEVIDERFGRNVMFGMTAWWAFTAYSRLRRAYGARGIDHEPDLTPRYIDKIKESEWEESRKRAAITARQFISAVTHDDFLMAAAIYDAVYNTSKAETGRFMYHVVLLSIRISNFAEEFRHAE